MIMKACNHFLWSGNPFSKKPTPIALTKVQLPLKNGGLGLIDLIKWNEAAFSTYLNNLVTSKQSIWTEWCNKHYLGESNIWTVKKKHNASWVWRGVLLARDKLLPHLQITLSSISSVPFWNAPWFQRGLILTDILTDSEITQSRIPRKAKAIDYVHDGRVTLPHSSNQRIRML